MKILKLVLQSGNTDYIWMLVSWTAFEVLLAEPGLFTWTNTNDIATGVVGVCGVCSWDLRPTWWQGRWCLNVSRLTFTTNHQVMCLGPYWVPLPCVKFQSNERSSYLPVSLNRTPHHIYGPGDITKPTSHASCMYWSPHKGVDLRPSLFSVSHA